MGKVDENKHQKMVFGHSDRTFALFCFFGYGLSGQTGQQRRRERIDVRKYRNENDDLFFVRGNSYDGRMDHAAAYGVGVR